MNALAIVLGTLFVGLVLCPRLIPSAQCRSDGTSVTIGGVIVLAGCQRGSR